MPNELVTLSTHTNVTEAYMIINRLKEIDITATIADANIVGMDFLIGGAIQWIKVQVRKEDVERALDYLERETQEKVPDEAIPWDDVEPDENESPEERHERIGQQKCEPETAAVTVDTKTARLVTVAYRLAIFSVLFFPLTIVSLVVIVRAAFRTDDMTPELSRKFYLSLLINMGVIFVSTSLYCGIFGRG